jgi:hypothetical protein
VRYKPQTQPSNIKDVVTDFTPNSQVETLLAAAKAIGPKLQLDSAGYMSNKRQQAACGFAVIELAQRLKCNLPC